jgi:hypothetical protein
VHRINVDIGTALKIGDEFTSKYGLWQGMGGPTNTGGKSGNLGKAHPDLIQAQADADNLYSIGHSHHVSLGRHLNIVEKFDTSQARDDRGRWTSSGNVTDPHHFAYSHVAPPKVASAGRESYKQATGLGIPGSPDFSGVHTSPELQAAIAQAYDAAPMDDPAAHPAYAALADEVTKQYDYMTNQLGIKVEVTTTDPYRNVAELVQDIKDNGRIQVLSTATTGSHPYFTDVQNDQFRAVHDFFGHAATGRGFDRNGEEAAWVSHSRMFSDLARQAMTTETRGQNAALITDGQGFPPQKVAILPSQFIDYNPNLVKSFNPDQLRDEHGRWTSGNGYLKPNTSGTMQSLVRRAVAGGFTYQPISGEVPVKGLAVSPYPEREHVLSVDEATPKALETYRQNNQDVLGNEHHYMGAWRTMVDGKDSIVLDVSVVAPDEHDAQKIADKFNQEAFYNLKTGETTYVHPGAATQRYDSAASGVHKRAGSRSTASAGDRRARRRGWPGWGADERLVAAYAPKIAKAVQSSLDVDRVVDRVVNQMSIGKAPSRIEAGVDPTHLVLLARQALEQERPVLGPLEKLAADLLGESWVLGAHSANDLFKQIKLEHGKDWTFADHFPDAEAILASPGLTQMLANSKITMRNVQANRMDRLADAIAKGLVQGDSPKTVADNIKDVMDDPAWAETVARTEMARAQTAGALAEYDRLGVPKVEFLSAQDDEVDDLCQQNEDAGPQELGVGTFPNGNPPVHPNCRCVLTPVAAFDDMSAQEAADAQAQEQQAASEEQATAEEAVAADSQIAENTAEGQAELIDSNPEVRDYSTTSLGQSSNRQDTSLSELEDAIADSTLIDSQDEDYSGFTENVIDAGPATPIKPNATTPTVSTNNRQRRRQRRTSSKG